ncbi:endonuclease/exonuclease/phosphatase family protein [Aurantimonas sp. Leaf443]|uniref:endonuclease/exonuclease/phosphatase family protein n=1 Tax=Aurantimonas sp. Leaf443 TaxID=1736378 RepID=UPI0006FFB2D3|nr:endonuclease/exonuclease/phosphatase family protein [Aurantimonas sp. Leaf443]KQT82223.1 hypothetical protein ASG48_16455 [Aurantimonas sp. Leaf443]
MTTDLILSGLVALMLAATGISFLRVAHGFVRIFSFPRLQFLAIAVVLLAAIFAFASPAFRPWLAVGALIVIVVQAVCIAQFTPVRRPQSPRYEGDPDGPNTISVVSFNVKMSNRDYARAIAMVERADPDIAILMETDAAWETGVGALRERWPTVVSRPLDNAYGMILFSKLPLSDVTVQDLVMEDVPSIFATVRLRNGQEVRLYCVHPEPPVPHIDSLGRDAELVTVAKRVSQDPLASIVCGDLNDVAWSNTTRMFQRLSRLLDPRIGRGFYNSFDSRFFFLRWPLDHLFHDAHLQLVEMARLPNAGSDHFPMYFKLALVASTKDAVLPEKADAEDRAEAREITAEAKELEREAIGVDWEK